MTAPTQDRPRVRPPIDPRIRDRRIEVIRAAGRRRLRITLVVASTIVVTGLAYLAVQSPLLDVDHIRVTGNRRESVAKIVGASHVHKGDPVLFVDTGRVARRIEQLPWVARARVKRDLPGTIGITVTEYVPTAYVRVNAGVVALVASTGRVIGLSHAAPPNAADIVGERRVPKVGSLISLPQAAGVMSQLPARLAAQVQSIDVGGPSVTLDLRTPAPTAPGERAAGSEQIRLGTLGDLVDKGAAALAVLDHLAGQPFTYIDVAAPQAPVSH